MPTIARGQENQTSLLNWFTTINGTLTDMYEMSFQVFDITGGIPGTQIFPTNPGTWEDVTNAPGRFSVGSYYAYDNSGGEGWTPDISETLGTHRINWRWKATSGAPYQQGSEDFEVMSESAGSSVDTYISVADIRAEGLASGDYSDDQVLASINTWQAFLDRACRQWFIPKTMVVQLDGTDSDTILLGVPVISLEYLKVNNSTSELDPSYYQVYSGRDYPDNRQNPRIALSSDDGNIYSGYIGSVRKFRKGRKNQEFKGVFGYTEADGSVPLLIKRALTKLVVEKLTKPLYGGAIDTAAAPPIVGEILEEWTDGHKIKYDSAGGPISKRKAGLIGITQDQEILDIIKLYRAPLGAMAPANPSYN